MKKNNFIFLPKPLDILTKIAYTIDTVKERRIKKMVKVILKDTRWDENEYLELTEDQYRLLKWLDNREFMADVAIEVVESFEFHII